MNEQQTLISDTLNRLLTDLCTKDVIDAAEAGCWPEELWSVLSEAGITTAGIPEAAGGAGGEIEDSMLVLRMAGRFSTPVPLAEHFIAAFLLAEHGVDIGTKPVTVAGDRFNIRQGGKVCGVAQNVAFARWCKQMLVVTKFGKLCLIDLDACDITPGMSIAGEPRDRVAFDGVPYGTFDADTRAAERLLHLGAATRASLMAGALEAILEMSVQYSLERSQFGRPISRFQAIQQQLATLTGEVAASTMAATLVSSLDEMDIAIAKARVGEAVSLSTDIAHQVHGAMGYTMEHPLNQRTRRLWCWRNEYGDERFWQTKVGKALVADGADGLWNAVVTMQ